MKTNLETKLIKICEFGDFEFYIQNKNQHKYEINRIKSKVIADLTRIYKTKQNNLNEVISKNPSKFNKYIKNLNY